MSSNSYPNKLNHKHLAMVPLLAQPITNRQVADLLEAQGAKYSEQRIGVLRNSPLMQELVNRYRAGIQAMMMAEQVRDASNQLNALIPESIEQLEGLLRGAESEQVKLGSIKTVFDYAPDAPKQTSKYEASMSHTHEISDDAMRLIERALKETDDDVIDVTPGKFSKDAFRSDDEPEDDLPAPESDYIIRRVGPTRLRSLEEITESFKDELDDEY